MPVAKANGYMLSTFEVVAAHVWRIACKVRGLADDQSVKLYIPIDARPRLKDDPTMPKWYFGNLVFFTACIAKAGDIIYKPLWYVASKIHEALGKAKDIEYLKSAVDYLESQPEPVVVLRGPESVTSPNLLLNSWVHIPFSKADFGWGQPKFLGNGGIKYEGLCFLGPNPNRDGSFLLSINLFKVHKPHFEKCLNELKIIPKI
ncbi:shikimate O-hydroxycinnamoyltransferase-like [Chenopodium quinoa]|uniref:shikimate O-hydroxycinnamoyltransferase-like n=1 Tax=Chenopodium quinoa TaxID=63459 RepID=UPI000B78E662|nr:shikimate O-hydroxycinnamoyltransferase-like [Chenopodium quinoa]